MPVQSNVNSSRIFGSLTYLSLQRDGSAACEQIRPGGTSSGFPYSQTSEAGGAASHETSIVTSQNGRQARCVRQQHRIGLRVFPSKTTNPCRVSVSWGRILFCRLAAYHSKVCLKICASLPQESSQRKLVNEILTLRQPAEICNCRTLYILRQDCTTFFNSMFPNLLCSPQPYMRSRGGLNGATGLPLHDVMVNARAAPSTDCKTFGSALNDYTDVFLSMDTVPQIHRTLLYIYDSNPKNVSDVSGHLASLVV